MHVKRVRDTNAWVFQVWVAFLLAAITSSTAVYNLPINFGDKGFIGTALLFLTASTFTLAKTIRDKHEYDFGEVTLVKRMKDTAAWYFQTWVAFICSAIGSVVAVYFLPIDDGYKGFVAMSVLFLVSSTFTLAKTIRDQHEHQIQVEAISQVETIRGFETPGYTTQARNN